MSLKRVWLQIQRAFLRRAQDDRDLEDEIRFHLDQEVQLRVQRGVPLADAQREARRDFGTVALTKERIREVWVSTRLEQLLQDLRYGTRILIKAPALSATAILLVALVIGGNATVFAVANGILQKPAPGVRSGHLVTLNWVDNSGIIEPASSYANYVDLASQSVSLRPLFAYRPFVRFALNHERGSYAVNGTLVTRNYFESLGVRLVRGRAFTEDEVQGTDGLAAVISHRVWQDFFEGDQGIVGRTVSLSGLPAVIVGVADADFEGTRLAESVGVWAPLASYSRITGRGDALLTRLDYSTVIGGQLAEGFSLAQSEEELSGIWSRLTRSFPELEHLKVTLIPYSAVAGTGTGVDEMGGRVLALFSVVTLLTVVIVCANVANLFLARIVTRQREMAVRQSLGASRGRLVRMLVAEGLVLSSIAAGAALLFAWWVSRLAVALFPPTEGPWATIARMDFTPDWNVAVYALTLAALSVVAFTVAPAARTWRFQLLPWLKAGEPSVISGRSRLSSGLVIVQLAFSVLLLTSAGLAYRSLFSMRRVEPGFNADGLLRISVNTAGSTSNPETHRTLLEAIRQRARAIPGVEEVTYAALPLFRDGGWLGATLRKPDGSAEPLHVQRNLVGPDYLRALGIATSAGEGISASFGAGSRRVAVVSENVATALWPGESALGRKLSIDLGADLQQADGAQSRVRPPLQAEVIGVVRDGFYSGLRRQHPRFVFLAAQQNTVPPGDVTLYVRYRGALDATVLAFGRALREVDPRTAIVSMGPMNALVQSELWPMRTLSTLLALFAGLSLFIAAIGQYALVSFDMRRRFRELGLRMALGASSRQVLSAVVRDGFRLTAFGVAIGFALSVVTGQGLGSLLYGVTPTDLLTYAGVFSMLSAASLVACYLPARRAATIHPMSALRQD